MRVSSKASAAGFLLLLVGTQVQSVQAESYLDTTLQEMTGFNIHGRALQAEQQDGGAYQFYTGEDGHMDPSATFGVIEMIGMAIGFTATAIFIIFTMIMICVDAGQRNKDLKKALEDDLQTMQDLDFSEEEIATLRAKFIKQDGMNLDQLREAEEAEQMAAMN